MTAILTETTHGTVSSITTAYNALKAGRTAAGFGTTDSGQNQLVYDDATTTAYNQIYKFTSGTGTYADTYIKFYNSSNRQFYHQGQEPALTSGNPNGALVNSGDTEESITGVNVTRLYLYASNKDYRSLSFKPTSGSDYGIHVYQAYDSAEAEWKTVLAEAFFKANNKPASFSENLAPSTVFMFAYGYAYQMGAPYHSQYVHDKFSWRYTDQPYGDWSASPTNTINTTSGKGHSPLALMCKSGFPNYGIYGGLNTLGEGTNTTFGYNSSSNSSYQAFNHTQDYDWMAHLCEPVKYGVADLVNGSTAKLAGPLILRNRGLDIGTANVNDVFLGPEFDPGTVLEVSASERYTSAFGHIYLRTT